MCAAADGAAAAFVCFASHASPIRQLRLVCALICCIVHGVLVMNSWGHFFVPLPLALSSPDITLFLLFKFIAGGRIVPRRLPKRDKAAKRPNLFRHCCSSARNRRVRRVPRRYIFHDLSAPEQETQPAEWKNFFPSSAKIFRYYESCEGNIALPTSMHTATR